MEFGEIKYAQLHHFADASEGGYGTVTYIRMLNQENNIQVTFLLGKARVTPLKAVTIPRLELTAAVLAVRMDTLLKSELDVQVENSVFWTDSNSVLKYLNNEDRCFHTFVANRISTIRETSEPSQWRSQWTQEVRKEVMVNTISVCDISSPSDQLIAYFSDWRRLKTAVAWILRLKVMLLAQSRKRKQLKASVANCLEKGSQDSSRWTDGKEVTSKSMSGSLTLDELLGAEGAIIRYCQRQRFGEEMSALSSGKMSVSRRSPIYRLDTVLEDGFLRVGGRLSKGAMPEEAKHPLILSKDQHISTLILRYVHQNLGNGGRTHTLSKVRRRFWITNANAAVRKIIGECSFSRCYNGRAVELAG